MTRERELQGNLPLEHCFSIDDFSADLLQSRRSRFGPVRRREVAGVRAVGACFRCQLMKTPCSSEKRPCPNCVVATESRHASSHLWMRCVPSVLGKLTNFFQGDISVPENALKNILSKNNHLAANPVTLEFEKIVEWDINALSNKLASGMREKNRTATISIVGILSSSRFQQVLSPFIPPTLCENFQLLMYTSSIVYSHGFQDYYCSYSQEDFNTIRLFTGTKVLKGLQTLLKPTQLARVTAEKRRAIFLLLFGSILAVSFHCQSEDDVERMSTREFCALREKLLSVLSHRLVDFAHRLKPINDDATKRALVDSAGNQFDLPKSFKWKSSRVKVTGPRGMDEKLPPDAGEPHHDGSHPSVQERGPVDAFETFDPSLVDQFPMPAEVGAQFCCGCRILLPRGVFGECYSCECLRNQLFDPFVWIFDQLQPLPEVSLSSLPNEATPSSSVSRSENTFTLDYEASSSGMFAPFEACDVLAGSLNSYTPNFAPLTQSLTNSNLHQRLI